jgi:outer membrane protein OmpA-like peptidoglycan-associated protein
MKTVKSFSWVSGVLLAALQGVQVQADQVQMYDHPPSAAEMGQILFGQPSYAAEGMKMRSISFTPKPKSVMEIEQSVEAERVSVGLPIEFAYNSTEILQDSKPFLDEVGKMLTMADFANKRLIIEGHTDAAGSDSYNLALSKRRARAVSDFLVQNYGVSRKRLQTNGLGEQRPLSGRDPYDEVNRRVQFYSAN